MNDVEKIKIKKCYRHPYKPLPPHEGWLSYITKNGTTVYSCKWCDEIIKENIKRWKEELKRKNKELDEKAKENLTDWYIKKQITKGIKKHAGKAYELITEDMVELFRSTVKLQRLIDKKKEPPKPVMECRKHDPLFIESTVKAGKNRTGKIRYKCKQCQKDMHKDHYLRNKEIVLAKCKKYKKDNPDKVKIWRKNYVNKKHQSIEGKSSKGD